MRITRDKRLFAKGLSSEMYVKKQLQKNEMEFEYDVVN